MNKKSNTFFVVLTAIFIALTLISSYISSLIKLPFLGGNTIELYLIFYVFAIILIKKMYYKLFYFITIPLINLMIPGLFFLNPLQVFIEYILAFYVFFPFLFFDKILDKKNRVVKLSIFFLLLLICIFLKLTCHLIAGYFWWTNYNIYLSFVLNCQYVLVSFAIILPVQLICFPIVNNLYINNY